MGRGESERAAASLTQQDILARATPRQVLRSPYSMKWASHKWQNIVTLCTYMKTQGWKKKKKHRIEVDWSHAVWETGYLEQQMI